MADRTFSERLVNARKKRGLTIEQASSSLRIRPGILIAFETNDFDHMPLRGHSRNMVSSYARFLGLDSAEITELFLREYRDYEENLSRGNRSNRVVEHEPRRRAYQRSDGQWATRTSVSARRGYGSGTMWHSGQRQTIDHDTTTLDRGYDSRSPSVQRVAAASARRKSYDKGGHRSYNGQTNRGSTSFISRLLGPILRHPLALLIGLAVLLVVILVAWALAANSCAAQPDAPNLPVTGVSSEPEDVNADGSNIGLEISDQIVQDARYGPFELVVEVGSGKSSWLEITLDGENKLAEVVNGPWSQSYTVIDVIEISAGAPGNVSVYRNGQKVELEIDAEAGIGMLKLEVEEKPVEKTEETTTGTTTGSGGSGSTPSGSSGDTNSGTTGTSGSTNGSNN